MKWYENPFHALAAGPSDFSKLWNLIGVIDGVAVCHDPFTVTSVAYFPLAYMKDPEDWSKQMDTLMRSFTSVPHGTILNTYLLKFFESPGLKPVGGAKKEWDILNFLERKRVDILNEKESPTYLPFIAITMPVDAKYDRRENALSTYIQEQKFLRFLKKQKAGSMSALNALLGNEAQAKNFRDTIAGLNALMDQIRLKFSGGCQRLDTDELTTFLSCLLNHTNQRPVTGLQSLFASDAYADPDQGFLHYGGKWHATISARTKDLPKELSSNFNWLYYDESVAGIPFNVQATVRFPERGKTIQDAQKTISRMDTAGSFFAGFKRMFAHQRAQMQEAIDMVIAAQDRFVDLSYTISIWADTKDELESNLNTLRNVLQGRDFRLSQDTYNLKAAWHCQIPWVSPRNRITSRVPGVAVAQLLPTLYPPVYIHKGKPKEPIWFHTKYDQLTSIEPFDRRCSVWNGVVVGQSGRGKSFLLNYLAMNACQNNSKLFIIDKGGEGAGSFRNLVFNLGGTYVELDFSGRQNFAVNPFDGPMFYALEKSGELDDDGVPVTTRNPDVSGSPATEKVGFLLNVLSLMLCDNEEDRMTKEQEAFLQTLLEEHYRKHNNNIENTTTITTFAKECLLALHKQPREVGTILAEDAKNWSIAFYNKLNKYVEGGMFGNFFKQTIDLRDQDVFCFDLQGIDAYPDLRGILTSVIVNYCYSLSMDGNPGRKKLILIDEAWALLGGGKMTSVIEEIWRTIRKHGGRIYCATQDFGAIMKSPAGTAIMNNSTYFWMIGSVFNWEDLSKIKAAGAQQNTISPWDYEAISQNQFNPPHYSELFFMNPVYKGVLRFRPSKWDYQLATSDADDKKIINQIKAKHDVRYITPEVLDELVSLK